MKEHGPLVFPGFPQVQKRGDIAAKKGRAKDASNQAGEDAHAGIGQKRDGLYEEICQRQ